MPMVFTVILLVFPREKRGTAMGIIGLIIGFAPAVGPSLSGVLVDNVGWRALFAIVTALGVVVVALAAFSLRNYGKFARHHLRRALGGALHGGPRGAALRAFHLRLY